MKRKCCQGACASPEGRPADASKTAQEKPPLATTSVTICTRHAARYKCTIPDYKMCRVCRAALLKARKRAA